MLVTTCHFQYQSRPENMTIPAKDRLQLEVAKDVQLQDYERGVVCHTFFEKDE